LNGNAEGKKENRLAMRSGKENSIPQVLECACPKKPKNNQAGEDFPGEELS